MTSTFHLHPFRSLLHIKHPLYLDHRSCIQLLQVLFLLVYPLTAAFNDNFFVNLYLSSVNFSYNFEQKTLNQKYHH